MRVSLAFLLLLAACRAGDPTDHAIGTLEMVEVDVGPLQPARALRVLVSEGDHVRVGDTLAVFTTPTMASAQAQAEGSQPLFAAPLGGADVIAAERPGRFEAVLGFQPRKARLTSPGVSRFPTLPCSV